MDIFEFFDSGLFSHAQEQSPELRYVANKLKDLTLENSDEGFILSEENINFVRKYAENDLNFKLLYVFHLNQCAVIYVPTSVRNVFGFQGLHCIPYGKFLDRNFLADYDRIIGAIPKNLIGTHSEFNFFV